MNCIELVELVTELVRSMAPAVESGEPLRRAAVIFNPSKVTDWITFRRHVEYELKSRGWDRAPRSGRGSIRPPWPPWAARR